LQEGLHLQIGHIDGGRQLLHVCHGKGGKDRYVPLPEPILEMLRQYWVTHRDPMWIFPSTHQTVKGPMNASGVQRAFIDKLASVSCYPLLLPMICQTVGWLEK